LASRTSDDNALEEAQFVGKNQTAGVGGNQDISASEFPFALQSLNELVGFGAHHIDGDPRLLR
jgi:hypothetical protein